jgi:flagellar biosynthesis protein FlhF
MELEDELRKTQSRIVSAQAELNNRSDSDASINLQLFSGKPVSAVDTHIEPTLEEPPRPFAYAPAAAVEPAGGQRAFDSMRSELNGLRELLEVQLGSLAWNAAGQPVAPSATRRPVRPAVARPAVDDPGHRRASSGLAYVAGPSGPHDCCTGH